jgi:Flp pilus assembly protein TadB
MPATHSADHSEELSRQAQRRREQIWTAGIFAAIAIIVISLLEIHVNTILIILGIIAVTAVVLGWIENSQRARKP